jgi:hypothetical protein
VPWAIGEPLAPVAAPADTSPSFTEESLKLTINNWHMYGYLFHLPSPGILYYYQSVEDVSMIHICSSTSISVANVRDILALLVMSITLRRKRRIEVCIIQRIPL